MCIRDRFSLLRINGNTRLFKGITTITIGAEYSFYGLSADGLSLDTTLYIKSDNKLLRFSRLQLRFSTRLSFSDIKNLVEGKPVEGLGVPGRPKDNRDKFEDLLASFSTVSYTHLYQPHTHPPDHLCHVLSGPCSGYVDQ